MNLRPRLRYLGLASLVILLGTAATLADVDPLMQTGTCELDRSAISDLPAGYSGTAHMLIAPGHPVWNCWISPPPGWAERGSADDSLPPAPQAPGTPEDRLAASVNCPPDGIYEGEPMCSDGYTDEYNGGCNSTPEIFGSIACGDTICGTSGTFWRYSFIPSDNARVRDTDWFQTDVVADSTLHYELEADFPVQMLLIDGTHGCDNLRVIRAVLGDPGEIVTISACVPPGTYWLWIGPQGFTGVVCGVEYVVSLTCETCTAPPGIACPPGTMLGQPAIDGYGPWAAYVSNDKFPDFDPAKGVKLLEHFIGVGGIIEGIEWWGIGATYDDAGVLTPCPLDPGTFTIEFYAHDEATHRPDYELGPLYSFTVDEAAGLTVEDTGHVYAGEDDDYPLYKWTVALPAPYAAFEGWISIQNADLCQFWWVKSEFGGTIHVTWDEETGAKTDEQGDLSYCLTSSNPGPFTGACCDTSTGACRDTEATDCVGCYDVWYQGIDCATLGTGCQGVTWACCISGDACITVDRASCDAAAGTFWSGWVCTTADPRYDGENLVDCEDDGYAPLHLSAGILLWKIRRHQR